MYFDRLLFPVIALLVLSPGVTAEDGRLGGLDHRFKSEVVPHLKEFCLDCHGPVDPEAKLDLSRFSSLSDVNAAHKIWKLVLERIEAVEMPPKEVEQPSEQERALVVDWIRAAREANAHRNAGDPGIVLARRLSNAEYNYTIRDLTGVDIRPTDTFPIDAANEAGFDNSGESLSMSPALLKKYLSAARQVSEHLVLLPTGITFASHPVVTDTDRDKYCVRRIVDFYERQPVDYSDYFYAAWQYQNRSGPDQNDISISDVAKANRISPRYLQTIWDVLTDGQNNFGPIARLRAMWSELPPRKNENPSLRKRCEAMRDFVEKLRRKLVPKIEPIEVEGLHKGSQTMVLWRNRQYAANRQLFHRKALDVDSSPNDESNKTRSNATPIHNDSVDHEFAGDATLVVPADEAKRKLHEAAFARFCNVFPDAFFISERGRDYVADNKKQQGEKGRLLSAGFHSMMGYYRDDKPLYDLILDSDQQRQLDELWQQLDFVASAPMRQYVGFLWFERTDSRYMRDPEFDFARAEDRNALSAEMIARLSEVYVGKAQRSGGSDVAIEAIKQYFREINDQIRWVERTRLAAESSHVQAATDFAERAYRRPLSLAERTELSKFYRTLRHQDGLSHEEAIRDVFVSILMSPHFSYRVDKASNTKGTVPLSDFELANRMSYFLWSSMPDAELMREAKSGRLRDPDVLTAQARRMLRDDRVGGLAMEFAGNWLDVRRFEQHNSVDRNRFPQFNDQLRRAMSEEPIRFFVDLVQRDRSLLNLLDADYTFVNGTLAQHYGIGDVELDETESEGWRRLDSAKIYGRGGLLPMSVFLTKNAPGLRTSPVKRGYWVVRRLLGERIPPPPPGIPEIPDDESKLGDLTLRETLARHRENQSCSVCHQRIDSIGLVFEGFGPIGQLRTKDLGGRPIDTTATLPGGHDVNGVEGLVNYLVEHRQDEFVVNFSRKLLSYALGRGLILPDDLLIEDICADLRARDFRFSVLVEKIVTSPQFLNKRGRIDSP